MKKREKKIIFTKDHPIAQAALSTITYFLSSLPAQPNYPSKKFTVQWKFS